MTHNLPSGLWAALMAAQLNSTIRTQRPRLHRALGYALASLSVLLMLGVAVMRRRRLFYSMAAGAWGGRGHATRCIHAVSKI